MFKSFFINTINKGCSQLIMLIGYSLKIIENHHCCGAIYYIYLNIVYGVKHIIH